MNEATKPGGQLPDAARRVAEALAGLGHDGAVRILADSTRSAAEAAAALGVERRQIAKSLVFRGRHSDDPVLAFIDGTRRVDVRLLGAAAGEPVERPDAAWVRARTGFAIGGVAPVAHPSEYMAIADPNVVGLEELWAAAGTPRAVFPLSGRQLVALTDARIAAIREER